MTELHDLSAVELLARYRAKSVSPSEVFADVEKHVARWEPHIKALYAYDPESARAEAKASTERWAKGAPSGPLDGVPVTVKENIATKGTPMPLGTAAMPLDPDAAGRAAPCPVARGRRDHLLQDHDAGLRHDVIRRVELPSAHAQSVGPDEESRRLELRRGRGRRGRLRPAACRHRHRRLGATACRLVRACRPETEPRAHPDRSALCGALSPAR